MNSLRGSRFLVISASVAVAILALELLATSTTLGSPDTSAFIGTWSYRFLLAGAAVAVLARVALVREGRVAWGLLAFGLVMWNAGDLYYYTILVDNSSIPYPSLGDALYLSLYVGFLGGLLARGGKIPATGRFHFPLVVCVLGMATLWSWLVFGGVLNAAEGSMAAVATTAAYPVLDLFLLVSTMIALSARGWQLDRPFLLLIAGFTVMAAGDLIYAAQVAKGAYVDGTVLDAVWPAGALGVAFAAWSPAGIPDKRVQGDLVVAVLTTCAAMVAAGLLILDRFEAQHTVTLALAGATLLAALVQLTLLFGQRNRAHSDALAAELLRSASTEAALDCVISIDAHGIVCEWNAAAAHTFGRSKENAMGRDIADLIIPLETRDRYHHGEIVKTTGHRHVGCFEGPILNQRLEMMAVHAGGGSFPVEVAVTRVQEHPPVFTAFVRDISERRGREEENERLAAIVRSSEDAILSKDLNGVVTAWNQGAEELYGFSADEAVGKKLVDLTIPADRVQEMEAIVHKVLDGESVAFRTQRLRKSGELLEVSLRAFPIRDLSREIVGLSMSAHDITDRRRREELDLGNAERQLWRRRIEAALAHDRFLFWGQPVLDLETGELHHYELLLRMDLEGQTITPNEFLPHAENSHLITEIDYWAISRGAELGRDFPVAINLSAKSLSNGRLIDHVRESLASAGTPPANVVFEITETAAAENLGAAHVLVEELKGLGCGVALDDFGTGYGSFNYLKHLPVTELKIDITFTRNLTDAEVDRRVVKSIVLVAKNFEIRTVAEGVEDEATLQLLREMGVDLAQGYHLGYPRRMRAQTMSAVAASSN